MTEEELVEAMCKAAYGDVMAAFFPMRQALRAVRPIIERETLERAAKLIDEGFDKVVGKSFRKDGIASKNDHCLHGRYMYEDCDACCAAAIRALAEGE